MHDTDTDRVHLDLTRSLAPYTASTVPCHGRADVLRLAGIVHGSTQVNGFDARVTGYAVDVLHLLLGPDPLRKALCYLEISTGSCLLPTALWAEGVLTAFRRGPNTTTAITTDRKGA